MMEINWDDFGEEIGERKSSAQITDCYGVDELPDKDVPLGGKLL